MRRVSKYRKLQMVIIMEGYCYTDIADHIGHSVDYVGRHLRMDQGKTFPLEEAYQILDLLKIPKERIFEYFPPNGEAVAEVSA